METKQTGLLRIAREAFGKRASVSEEEGAEYGFTLIELMVVLLILAILLAIAIPTFLGVKTGAQDRAAQSNLTNALTSAKSIYSTLGSYPTGPSLIASLSTQEPELSFVAAGVAPTAANQISLAVSTDNQQLVMVNESASGTCWAVSDNDNSTAALGTQGNGTTYDGYKGTCTATAAAAGSHFQLSYPTSAFSGP